MADNFNWYSEEDVEWEAEPAAKPPRQPRPFWRWLLLIAIVAGLAGGGGLLLYRRLDRQVDEVAERVETDLRAGHALTQQAARQADADLFTSFLSGRDGEWAAAQVRLLDAGLFYRRRAFGLSWLPPDDPETAVAAVDLNPELNSATLTLHHQYALDVGNGLTHTVTLSHTAVYRRGADRWLFSPPESDFWGERQSSAGRYLTLRYPARDAALGRRLAADLDAKLHEMCARLADLDCADDFHLTVTFTPDPDALYLAGLAYTDAIADADHPPTAVIDWLTFPITNDAERLTMPTPSLIGRPLNEAGYQALYRGYAGRLLSAAIARQVGWSCCRDAVLFQALLDAQLAELGVKPAAAPPTLDPALLFEAETTLAELAETWERRDTAVSLTAAWPAYLLVDFLAAESGDSAAALQRTLADWEGNPGLTRRLVRGHYPIWDAAERDWRRMLAQRAPQPAPPLPWPDYDLQLACREYGDDAARFYRYDPAGQTWSAGERLNHAIVALAPLPGRDGVAYTSWGAGPGETAVTTLRRAGQRQIIAARENSYDRPPLPLAGDPTGQYLLIEDETRNTTPYALLPLAPCLEKGECRLQSVLGRPFWSPDGAQTILVSNEVGDGAERLLFLGDQRGQNVTLIGEGTAPFWLDETTAGYVSDGRQIILLDTESLSTTVRLTQEDLHFLLLAEELQSAGRVTMQRVMVSPSHPGQLLIWAATSITRMGGGYYVVRYDMAADEFLFMHLTELPYDLNAFPPRLSPDGDWIALMVNEQEEMNPTVLLHHLPGAETLRYPLGTAGGDNRDHALTRRLDWTPDGRWAALVDDGAIRLIAAGDAYQYELIPDGMACQTAVWIER